MKKYIGMAGLFLVVGLSTTDLVDAEELNLEEAIPDEALRDAVKASLETEESIIDEAMLEQLVQLDGARGQGIADLTGLEHFTNLENIELRSNEITDLGPLQRLGNLESIDLRQNHIRDLAALEGLTSLLDLDLRGNAVSDLSALESLVNLETLDLRQNQVASIDPLANLHHLEELNLRENSVHDLQPLRQLVQLKELNLHTNRVNDLSPISNLERLEVLTLRRNQVTDLSPLQSLVNLNDMNLRDNDIDSLEPLASLPRLTERLHVRGNDRLTDYSPVESYYANIKDVDFILRPLMPFPLEHFDTQTSAERQRTIYESLVRNNSHFKDESIFEQKFQTMNTGMFSFFRGSSHLYADDALRGNMGVPDVWLEDDVNTWITGDFHVENIGFYGNGSGEPVFDFNDFDEVVYAPFYYDLIRYGSSLIKLNDIAPGLQLSDDEISDVITEFVLTYTNELQKVADGEIEPNQFSFTPEHTEGFVKETAEELQSISQLDELNTWTTMIGEQRRFEEDNPRLATASEAEKTMINTYWQNYVHEQTQDYDLDEEHFEIKDIARRTNAGLGSLGYDRYYVLIEGASDSEDDDIILDVKAQTKAPFEEEESMQTPHAERTITGAKALLPDNHSPYWGMLDTEEQSFSVRERSRYKEEFGEASFESKEQLESVVQHSARAATIAHSRANPAFAENASGAIHGWEDFEKTLTEISVQYYGQVIHDYDVFSAQYTNGFFEGNPYVPTLLDYVSRANYQDVSDTHYAVDEINAMYALEIMTGNSSGQFMPARHTTRTHYTVMLVRALGLNGDEASFDHALSFADVDEDTWYVKELSAAIKHGLIQGYSDGTFRGEQSISRIHSIRILGRMLEHTFDIDPEQFDAAPFTDLDNIDEETQSYVNALYHMKVYQGRDGVLSPSERSSRAQAAVVFYRLLSEMQSLQTTR